MFAGDFSGAWSIHNRASAMLGSLAWHPAANAKLLALIAAAVLIRGTLEVASHTDSSNVPEEASSSSAQNRLFDQIAEDLKPFASGISLQQVERAFCAGGDNGGFRYTANLSEPVVLDCASQCGSQSHK